MNLSHHTHPDNLERYSFIWSEVRLIIAAAALLLGGVPPVLYVAPGLRGLLPLAWIVSGLASGYLLYRWNASGQRLFGGKEKNDLYAFFVSTISGLNLGLTGLLGNNISMSFSSNYIVFIVVAVAYLFAAKHLFRRWRAHREKVF